MKKNSNMTYMDTVHRDGTIWNLTMMVILLMFPILVCILFKDAMPDWKGVALGLVATAPMYWAVGIVEVITFIPMLGAGGSYLSFVTGNNKKNEYYGNSWHCNKLCLNGDLESEFNGYHYNEYST